MTEAGLEISGLSISGPRGPLLKDIRLTLPASGITALLGPSGCGKTSVLKWLAGILPPGLRADGQLTLNGAPLKPPHPAICYHPQSDALLPWARIIDNAALGLVVRGLPRHEARARVKPFFRPFGLEGCEELWPEQLSGGMRQRAAFLRSILTESRFLLLDEPFSALDAVTRLQMQRWLLARLAERPRGLLLVTHDLHEATSLADRILVLAGKPGRLIAELDLPLPPEKRSEASLAPLRETLKTLLLKETE